MLKDVVFPFFNKKKMSHALSDILNLIGNDNSLSI